MLSTFSQKIQKHFPFLHWAVQYPVVFVLFFVFLATLCFSFGEYQSNRQRESLANKYFEQSRNTQLNHFMGSLIQHAANDSALLNHLNFDRPNSLESGLKSYLQKGTLDFLALLDSNCQVIASSKLDKVPFVAPCQSETMKKPPAGFRTIVQHEVPWEAAFVKVNSGAKKGEHFLVGARQKSPSTVGAAAYIHNHIQARGDKIRYKSYGIAIFCLMMALAFLVLMQVQFVQFSRSNIGGAAYLKNWLLGQFRNHHRLDLKKTDRINKHVVDFDYFKYLVQALIDENHESTYHQSVVNQTLDEDIGQLETEVQELRIQLQQAGKWAPSAQLASQLNASTKTQLQDSVTSIQTAGFKHLAELTDVASQLSRQLEYWKLGIQERGARKFLRSLSELGSNDRHSYLLDSHLAKFFEWGDRLAKLSHDIQIDVHGVHEKISYVTKNIESWQAFQGSEEIELNLVQLVHRTQNMLSSRSAAGDRIVFCNQIEENPKFPTSTSEMLALVYLLYDYGICCYGHSLNKVEIHTRLKIDFRKAKTRATLAISFDSMDYPQVPAQLHEKAQLIEVIAQKCHIHLSPLNALRAQVPLVLYWDLDAEELETVMSISEVQRSTHNHVRIP